MEGRLSFPTSSVFSMPPRVLGCQACPCTISLLCPNVHRIFQMDIMAKAGPAAKFLLPSPTCTCLPTCKINAHCKSFCQNTAKLEGPQSKPLVQCGAEGPSAWLKLSLFASLLTEAAEAKPCSGMYAKRPIDAMKGLAVLAKGVLNFENF